MNYTKTLTKNWRITENVIFVFAFGFILYNVVSIYLLYIRDSLKGKGYIGAIVDPILKHNYYLSIVSAIIVLNTTCILWELIMLIIRLFKQESTHSHGYAKYKLIFKQVLVNYKPSFLALFVYQLLPKLILIHMFWIWLPHVQRFGLFTINLKWYSWIYAYLCWELSTWLFHFSSHRVRFLWCLHSPHHAPIELNMTVTWIHFFAEAYYSTLIHLVILTLLGVNPLMFVAIMAIENAWGAFIHVSEGALKNGKMGFLQHFIITPAHHRVHHGKNPLYIDTNFASLVPLWDWLFGTLQPLKDEVKVDYGISRELDVTNFSDLYFGELLLLWLDVKNAVGIKNKLLYIIKSPGWKPSNEGRTALDLRRDFLNTNPELGMTSKSRVLAAIRAGFKMDSADTKAAQISTRGVEDGYLSPKS